MPISFFIVDDESSARDRLKYLLDQFMPGKTNLLGEESNPVKALDQIITFKPELLFLDVEMPEMSGLELATKLKEKGFLGTIIFITAYDQYAIKAIRASAFDYILKPIDVDVLKEAIDRLENKEIFNKEVIVNFDLSKREVELAEHLAKGLSSEEIAGKMFLSRHTVDTHRRNIHLKTGTKNAVELLNMLKAN